MLLEQMNEKFSFDLNEVPIDDVDEEQSVIVQDDQSEILDFDEPFVGQCFSSEEEAFAFYQNYARKIGFSVRKERFENKKGEKTRRDFFCHREGKPDAKIVDYSKQQRNRGSRKCECKAHIRIALRRLNEICCGS